MGHEGWVDLPPLSFGACSEGPRGSAFKEHCVLLCSAFLSKMLGTGGGSKLRCSARAMNDSEFLSILMRILSAAKDRQDASRSRSPPSSESSRARDTPVRVDEGEEGSGDSDIERGGSSVQRFIKRTAPKSAARRAKGHRR